MKFYKELYVGESLRGKEEKIIKKLKAGKFRLSCYVIALTENEQNQLEFFDSLLLLQRNYKGQDLFIVGIAGNYSEALEVVQEIMEDTYGKNGNADIRSYIIEESRV